MVLGIDSRRRRDGRLALCVWGFLALTVSGGHAYAQAPSPGSAPTPAQDPTEPLRRYPISFLVDRPSANTDPVSLLRLDALHPQDQLEMKVDPELARNWTFVSAAVAAGQRIQVKSWNLWEKKWTQGPVDIGKIPKGDVVPLFFLVLNPHREKKVADAIHNALETSAGQLISQTASFDSIYQQQNRLLNFMSAYAALGPKQEADPSQIKDRIALIDADLGMPYDPAAPQTQPGDLQHGLDAGVGILSTLRETPDNPGATAALAQQQLPAVVSDWVGLVGDLMHIFIKPPHQVKLTFIPASACSADQQYTKTLTDPDNWMQLMTERVLDTSGEALPTLVFRPNYADVTPAAAGHALEFERSEVLCDGSNVELPIGAASRDLFLHPWAWGWETSDDGKVYKPALNAQLIPGQGLVLSLRPDFWGTATDKKFFLRGRIGFDTTKSFEIHVAKVFPQTWSTMNSGLTDLAVGDHDATVHLARAGATQPYYHFASVSLIDRANHVISATKVGFGNDLEASFDLSQAVAGPARIRVVQEADGHPDQTAEVFIEPRHPSIALYCGQGDKELRVTGSEAGWVKAVKVNTLFVTESDDSDPANRRLTLSGALPDTAKTVDVTYHDPTTGLEWTRPVGVSVGLPRPRMTVSLTGTLPTTISVGAGPDPTWATASLPAGWFPTSQPVRIKLEAIKPYTWSHDVRLELGLGSAGDVQTISQLLEGPTFALDQDSSDAYVTLTLDSNLPQNPKRTSGLIWFRLTRTELASPWTLATTQDTPMRAVKLAEVTSVENLSTGTRFTLSNADEVLGVRFAGQTNFVVPQLVKSLTPGVLVATVDGPVGATEFDLQVRDAGDGLIHVKIVHPQK